MMIAMEQADWQQRRSQYNHLWLKNKFFTALDTADHVIHGRVRGDTYLLELMNMDVPEWREHREELSALLRDFENEMSPRRLFDSAPLSKCNPMTNEVLAELMHELWLARYPIKDWLNNARIAAEEVDAIYEGLCKLVPVDSNGIVLPDFASCFKSFRAACQILSMAIEKFPNKILVI